MTMQSIQARFSLFYFFIIGYLSFPLVLVPLLGHARGFDAGEIAWIGIASTIASVVGGPVFLQLATRRFAGRSLAQFGFTLCVLSLSGLYFTHSFLLFLLLWLVNQIAMQAYAIVDARAIRLSAERSITFEHVRLCGSFGFIALSFIFGFSLDLIGVNGSVLVAVAFVFLLLCSFQTIKDSIAAEPTEPLQSRAGDSSAEASASSLQRVALPVATLLLLNICSWASHSPFYLYYSVYLKELGWSGTSISAAWGVAVFCEILLFWITPRFCNSPRSYAKLLIAGTLAAAVRWLALSVSSAAVVILLTQTLHAFSWGAVYLSSMKLIFHFLPERYKDRGQGWVQAAGVGVGRLAGNIYFGYRANAMASYAQVPSLFFAASILALCCVPLSVLITVLVVQKSGKDQDI